MSPNVNKEVTVLMPVYNASLYLKEAIESILAQTFHDFEFIIINDGSTDNSLQIIRSFTDSRIKLINNEHNLGIIASRNIGLQAATGKFIANMDADDISLPERLQKQLDYFKAHPETVILAGRLVLVNAENEETGVWPEDYYCVSDQDIRNTLPVINCIGQPTIMMRAAHVKKIGYNKRFVANEDWGLWLHLLSQGHKIAKLPEVLLRYRQHTASTTVQANNSGTFKKIRRFKLNYLWYKLLTGQFRFTDKYVASSFLKELLTYPFRKLMPRLFVFAGRLKNLDKKRFLQQWRVARKFFKEHRSAPLLYFFPFFHTGGAEKVHASIMEAAGQKEAIVFITSRSSNRAFYKDFSQHAALIEIDELLRLGVTARWIQKKILALCGQKEGTTLFGCNSVFFYQLIPFLPVSAKVIDLLHAFVHAYEDGPEKWSLPVVADIDHRIVINQKTKNDLGELYRKHKLSAELISRVRIITNYVETSDVYPAKDPVTLKVAFVGRAGEEKRVYLIARAAKNIAVLPANIEFHFVGNIKDAIPESLRSHCIFHGEITSETEMRELYRQFHCIIITSDREGFPMVIMEGMMHGAIPVSTNVGGIPEHVMDGENGLLIYEKEEQGIVRTLEEKILYLHNSRSEWSRMSENAYAYAHQHFNKTMFIHAYAELLGKTKN